MNAFEHLKLSNELRSARRCHEARMFAANMRRHFGSAASDIKEAEDGAAYWSGEIARLEAVLADPLAALSVELEAWCEANDLALKSADEIRADLCEPHPKDRSDKAKEQIAWLVDFEGRWDAAEASRSDRRIDGYNPEFLGAKPAKVGEDY